MGSQQTKGKKTISRNLDRNVLSSNYKGKKLKGSADSTSVSSLDIISTLEGAVYASHDYDPPADATISEISVRKGDHLWLYGPNSTGEWLEIMCRRTGERGWVPFSCVFDPSATATLSPLSLSVPSPDDAEHTSCPTLLDEKWYHGAIHRSYAEYLLSSGITGSFLVRESESSIGKLTISLRSDGRIYHYRVCTDENNQFYINETIRFSSVMELVQHHEKLADGLACPLLYGVSKRDRSRSNDNEGMESDCDTWEINRADVIMKHKLGSGQYGVVYEAILKPYDVTVAVKTLKEDITLRDEFLQEARLMKSLRHPNLVRLLGVCTQEPPYYIITEFMCNGNLLGYLRTQPRDVLSPPVLLQMAIQVCRAMTYLEENSFIHRDLAARNCLVGETLTVKVADFGLARYMECDVTYRAREGAKFPIKWTAPEGLIYNCFSIKSDVWAFGVLLWEIATYGATPYPGIELQDVYVLLERGTRMEAPQGCPDRVYRLMLDCWSWNSEDRPTFKEICTRLETIHSSWDIIEAVENDLERHRIRMPLPSPPIPPPFLPRRSNSSCEHLNGNNNPPVSRGAHAESFTSHDISADCLGTNPLLHRRPHQDVRTCVVGSRFSEVFSGGGSGSGSGDVTDSPHDASLNSGSLGRKKAAPVPPLRTTTLRSEKHAEPGATAPVQVSAGDTKGLRRICIDRLSPPPAVDELRQLPQKSSQIINEINASGPLASSPVTVKIRQTTTPPAVRQCSESSESQQSGILTSDASVPPTHTLQASGTSSLRSHSTHLIPKGNRDFQSELSCRLKRQLECTRTLPATLPVRSQVVGTNLKAKESADATVTAEMIQASKSRLKTTSLSIASEQQTSSQTTLSPAPAWKELVVQRRLKSTESPTGKRKSWTPLSNNLNQCKTQQIPSIEPFPEEEEADQELPALMSQSVTFGGGSESLSAPTPLSFEQLLSHVTDLCKDLNISKLNPSNDPNNTLFDRLEVLKHTCLTYVDEVDCSAHVKFRFRDEFAKLQATADALRVVVCGSGARPSATAEEAGRYKNLQHIHTIVETIRRSLLHLTPPVLPPTEVLAKGATDEPYANPRIIS